MAFNSTFNNNEIQNGHQFKTGGSIEKSLKRFVSEFLKPIYACID
jgi:hypothetical protein